jgi:(p)ppGpp synthase/HD superfamily hydrolase
MSSDKARLIAAMAFKVRHPDTYSHTLRVAREFEVDTLQHQVALLHDVLEDAADLVDADTLLDFGFDPDVVKAVELLTRPDDLTYFEYVHQVAEAEGLAGALAAAVKRADARDNLNRSLGQPNRQRRYQRVLLILGDD